MPFAAALSAHPVVAHAVGEVAGQVLDTLGGEAPDLALVFLTGHHSGAVVEVAHAIRHLLRPATLLGATASGVLANGNEVADAPALALWAGSFGAVQPISFGRTDIAAAPPFDPALILLLVDPYAFALGAALEALSMRWPGVPVVGGMASASGAAGRNRLVLDDSVLSSGAAGVLVGPGLRVETATTAGARPLGRPYVVTSAGDRLVRELGGRPAAERLRQVLDRDIGDEEFSALGSGGLCLGRVVDERSTEAGCQDVLVSDVVAAGADGFAVEDDVEVGQTWQFLVRDAEAADDDLRAVLNGREADTALAFCDLARGRQLFGSPSYEAGVLAEYLRDPPTAGMFCAGELGAIGGRNFVLGRCTSIALLSDV